jgi:hypothetical protein
LVGCGNADTPLIDLDDFDGYGSLYNMRIYVDKDMPWQQRSYVWDSARAHYLDFWFGTSVVYNGLPMSMNFGPPLGRRTLVNTGDVLFASSSNPTTPVNVVVTTGRVVGSGPMGPAIHYRALTYSRDPWTRALTPTIVLHLDKDGSGRGALDGLYTMLHWNYNADKIPMNPPLDYYTTWARIFAIDEALCDTVRRSR